MNPLTIFLSVILFRAASGVQNGAFYGKQAPAQSMATAWMVFFSTTFGIATVMIRGLDWPYYMISGLSIGSGVSAYILHRIMLENKVQLIHFWESVTTGLFTIAALWLDFWPALFGVYPGVYLFKAMVNIGGGNEWHYNGTDDPEGRFFTVQIPIVGWTFKVPRLTMQIRLVLSILSIFVLIVYLYH